MTPKPSANTKPEVVMVLGMHRSGTSALTGALHKLGMALGPKLIPTQTDNRTGFWENSAVVAFNKSLNQALDRTWHQVTSMPNDWWQEPRLDALLPELCTLIQNEKGEAKLWGLKDPRLCRTLPLWQLALERCKLATGYCLMLRHPTEVTASLQKRDGFTTAKGLLLWLDHVLAAERQTRTQRRSWVLYSKLLAEPVATLEEISQELSLPWGTLTTTQATAITQFLDPALRNHITPEGAASALLDVCTSVFQALCEAPEAKQTRLLLGRVKRDWQTSMQLNASWIADQAAHIQALEAEIKAARQAHAARDELEAATSIEQDRLKKESHSLRRDYANARQELEGLHKAQQGMLAEVRDLRGQIAIAKDVHDEKNDQIERARQAHKQLQLQLETAKQVHDQKEAELEEARTNIGLLEGQIHDARNNMVVLQDQVATARDSQATKDRELTLARSQNESLQADATVSRKLLEQKDAQIDQARDNIKSLATQIETARQALALKDEQIDCARDNLALLQNEIEQARLAHQASAEQIQIARRGLTQKDEQIDQARDQIAILQKDIDQAREAHGVKDQQIDEARDNIALLQKEIDQAREAHEVKDQQIGEARDNMALLQAEIDQARKAHDLQHEQIQAARVAHSAKDNQIEDAKRHIDLLGSDLSEAQRHQQHLQRQLDESQNKQILLQTEIKELIQSHAVKDSQINDLNTLREQGLQVQELLVKELNQAREIHDLKDAEIAKAREIHDLKVTEIANAHQVHQELVDLLDQARSNMGILNEQVAEARQAHLARDLIEKELRAEIASLKASMQPTKRRHVDASLRPQTET